MLPASINQIKKKNPWTSLQAQPRARRAHPRLAIAATVAQESSVLLGSRGGLTALDLLPKDDDALDPLAKDDDALDP